MKLKVFRCPQGFVSYCIFLYIIATQLLQFISIEYWKTLILNAHQKILNENYRIVLQLVLLSDFGPFLFAIVGVYGIAKRKPYLLLPYIVWNVLLIGMLARHYMEEVEKKIQALITRQQIDPFDVYIDRSTLGNERSNGIIGIHLQMILSYMIPVGRKTIPTYIISRQCGVIAKRNRRRRKNQEEQREIQNRIDRIVLRLESFVRKQANDNPYSLEAGL